MSTPKPQAAQPRTLSGTLAKTPFPRLLVSAGAARVSGTLQLASPDGEAGTVVMVGGAVTKVKTSAPVAYLGSVLYELGAIDSAELNDSLGELARTKWLHGEILLTRGAITPAQLAEGLAEQTTRKLVHLFSLSPETTYTFDSGVDALASWGGTDCPHVDPLGAVWRGLRDGLADGEIQTSLARAQESAFRLARDAAPRRFELSDNELSAMEGLRGRALTLDEVGKQLGLDAGRARALLYFLLITKQVEAVDTSGVHSAYRPAAPNPIVQVPGTKVTMPAIPALKVPPASGASSRQMPVTTPSAEWRALGPIANYPANPQAAIEAAQPAESGKMRKASIPAFTLGGVPGGRETGRAPVLPAREPPQTPSSGRMPVAAPASTRPPQASATPTARPPTNSAPPRSGAPSTHPSNPAFNAKVSAELSARKLSIFERARAILKEDYFQRLSLSRDARPQQVEDAFAALRNLWDPALLPPALEEAKDDCAFVMSCLAEAHTTLRNPALREDYTRRLAMAGLRTTSDQLAEDLAASGASDPYEGAQACFSRNDLERAERLARRAHKATPDQAAPLALLAWIEAARPANQTPEETKKRIIMLDKALRIDERYEQGFYWRGLLHKRLENHQQAMNNFKKVVEINPKNMDAVRELRVYEMRIRRNSLTMKAVK